MDKKIILAFVGMPGGGKTEAASYLRDKGIPFVRFGQAAENKVKEMGLELTPDNERLAREKLREELGMAAFAIIAKPKIHELLQKENIIALDGLYSWEEYIFLKEEFSNLILIHIYAEPEIRYERLENRPVRPIPHGKSRERDLAEIEKLNKGGPIAMADYLITNNGLIEEMYNSIENVLKRLQISI